MSIIIYKNSQFENVLNDYNSHGTLVLSSQKIRYRKPLELQVVQASGHDTEEIFSTALESFYADTIIIDLFDDWVKTIPQRLGAFLDDYDDSKYEASQLVLVLDNEKLINEWELENVDSRF